VDLSHCKLLIPQFWECLSSEEKEQARKYYTTDLSNRYIISHGILRYILSCYTKQLPQDIEFIHNKYGKPFLKNSNIHFNMSHSHEIVSYIITLNYRVGIDIELHNDNLSIEEFVDLVFTPKEYDFFTALALAEKPEFFFNLWTKKESLIKACGKGLSYPINTIEAMNLLSGEKIFLDDADGKFKQEWYYFPLAIALNYSGAIAVEHRINQIIYLEMNYQSNIFDKMKIEYFN
jgi:4'-phosphopantetheinyl transferase